MILYLFINKMINLIGIFKCLNAKFLDIYPYNYIKKITFYVHISVFFEKINLFDLFIFSSRLV